MSDDVVTPQDVLADDIRDKLVEAVIDAYMRKGCIEDGTVNMHWEDKNGTDWTYRLDVGGATDPEIACDSDGNWRHKKWWQPDDHLGNGVDYVDTNDNAYEVRLFDAKAKWDEIRTTIDSWLDPWVNDCPSPNEYTNQINSIATVARQLYVGSQPVAGSEGSPPTSADPDLWDSMTELDISADNTSRSLDVFQRSYSTDIWKTVGGQYSLVYAAGLALTAEAAAWNESYRSLRDFLKVAAHDFATFAGSGDGSGEGTEAALGATSAVAGLLGATVGVAFPPFGIAMGVLSSATGVAALMSPAVPAVEDASLQLEGDTFAEKWESFKSAMKDINDDLRAAELAVQDGCRAMAADVGTKPDNYSLVAGGTQGQGAQDDFEGMLGLRLDLELYKLKNLAGACQTIGDHQVGLAGVLGGTDADGASSYDVSDEWYRGYLPEVGRIGYGTSGPYWAYKALVESTIDLLVQEGKYSRQVADWMVEMIIGMDATDMDKQQELERLSVPFDRHDLSVGNDETDPNSVTST
ncbi:hypothetical protein ABFT23_13805 [Nocardioides sp. C4-1]|uniref:hypothetical protein n=1 Tax=Nocardioides sp. C4-1 TaxID=3151851 RepID=UPI0032642A8C